MYALILQGVHTRMSRVKVAKMIVSMGGEIDLERVVQPPQPLPEAQPPLADSEQPPLLPSLPDVSEAMPPLPDEDPEEQAARPSPCADATTHDALLPSDQVDKHAAQMHTERVDEGRLARFKMDGPNGLQASEQSQELQNGEKLDDRSLHRYRDQGRERERKHERGQETSTRDHGRSVGRERDRDSSYQERDPDRRDRDRDRGRDRDVDRDRGKDGKRRRDGDYSRRPDLDREDRGRVRERDYRRDRDRDDDVRRRRR